MIRQLLVSILITAIAPATIPAQSVDSTTTPISSSIACPVETGPPSTAPHTWVAVANGVMVKHKISGKDPKYPSEARKAHVDGRVVLEATISTSGDIEDLCVSQGPELFRQASYDAVKMWKYQPYIQNGQPVEVRTIIITDFTLH